MLPWNRLPQGADRLVAFVSLAALALGLLWSVDAATHVESYDEVSRIDPWGERGVFTYEPILVDGSGTRPMGEPGYFTSDAPTMRVAFAWALDDAAARRVTALGNLELRVGSEGSGRAAWEHVEPLAQGQLDSNPGDALVLEGLVDLPGTQARIEKSTGRDAAAATWTLVANVRFESAPIESHRSDASEFVLPIHYTPPLYSLPDEDAASFTKDHARSETTHRESSGGIRALAANPAGPILLLGGALGVLAFAPFREEADA